jgi:hypothetical protein
MNSFIYLYSKFTEELLLLGAAAIFTLLALYCYEWVIKKRRLGAARNQIPAAMVKVYLNQLINEAQFVRTQLFGLVNGMPPEGITLPVSSSAPPAGGESHDSPAAQLMSAATAGLAGDLGDRLKALQNQLKVGGKLFAFIGDDRLMSATIIRRVSHDYFQQKKLFEALVPSLVDSSVRHSFVF